MLRATNNIIVSNTVPNLSRSRHAARLAAYPGVLTTSTAAFANRGQWRDHFRHRIGATFNETITLEIGCFNAEFLCRIAAKHPTSAFIGIDWKCKPICDGAARVVETQLPNVALIHGRAQHINQIFADNEVNELWLFHPEPCEREHERNNRLINPTFLQNVHTILRDADSVFVLKTDHAGYYADVSEMIEGQSSGLFRIALRSPNFWSDRNALAASATHQFTGEATSYEANFVRKKKPIHFVKASKRKK